jgi:hypothetical protein
LDSRCKACKRNHAKTKYNENPEHSRAIQRKWCANNAEKARKASREWRDKYPERQRDSKRRYREKNLEKERATQRERNRRVKHDPVLKAKKKASDRRYREKNLERERQRGRDYRKNKPEIVKAALVKWYIENPEKALLLKQRRLARKRGLPDTLTIEQWTEAVKHWNGCCAYCSKKPDKLTLDHYIPLANTDCPGTVAENCIPACLLCNSSKNDTEAVYWMTWRFGKEYASVVDDTIQRYFASLGE